MSSTTERALETIAEIRDCSTSEARQYCEEVQVLTEGGPVPSYAAISESLDSLSREQSDVQKEEVCKQACGIHRDRLEQSRSNECGQANSASGSDVDKALRKIKKLRKCSTSEAKHFCREIRRLASGKYTPYNRSISDAVEKLKEEYGTRYSEFARVASEIHKNKITKSKSKNKKRGR